MMQNFGKLNMKQPAFWLGVVESIGDVNSAGRYKVRIFGYHTPDKSLLPTKDLPYAVPINPVTSAAMNGIMETPNLVQGSTVFGCFLDGQSGQTPVILGSIAGEPAEQDFQDGHGFSDPAKVYPRAASGTAAKANNEEGILGSIKDAITDSSSEEQTEEEKAAAKAAAIEEEKIEKEINDKNPFEVGTVEWLESDSNIRKEYEEKGLLKLKDKLTGGLLDGFGANDADVGTGYSGVGEPDISRLARGEAAETHYSLVNRRAKIADINAEGVNTAKAPFVDRKDDDPFKASADYETKPWKLPDARGTKQDETESPQSYFDPKSGGSPSGSETSLYPFNQVTETISGIVKEYDNTPGNIRISEFHPANTWYEVHNDGSKTTYVSGTDNVVIEGASNVFIQGNANVTVGGTMKQKVKGDYYLEVEGSMYTSVHKERRTEVGLNDVHGIHGSQHNEITGSQSNNINGQQVNTINGIPPGTKTPVTFGQVNTVNNGAGWIVNKADAGKGVVFNVEGNFTTKVGGGRTDEVGKAYKILARDNFIIQQAKPTSEDGEVNEFRITTAGPASFIHEDTHTTTIKKEIALTGDLTRVDIIKGQDTLKIDNLDIMKHDDSAVDIDVTGNMNLTGTVDAEVEVKAGDPEVTLTGHVHPQTGGTGGDGDSGVDTGTGVG